MKYKALSTFLAAKKVGSTFKKQFISPQKTPYRVFQSLDFQIYEMIILGSILPTFKIGSYFTALTNFV
jgi:hypothetical protein